jgi:hypothetical protein
MRTLNGYRTVPLVDSQALHCDDRVLVPDGRTGEVIGFYRGDDDERMLVLFDSGGTQRYVRGDLRLLL